MTRVVEASGTLTPVELYERLVDEDGARPLVILDVRNEEEFRSWRIEGRRPVTHVNIPYFEFLEEPEASVRRVPRDGELTVVCAKGDSSAYVADLLKERGIPARNLSGGMIAWGDLHIARDVRNWAASGATLIQVQRVGKGCLSYLLVSAGKALVVDPSRQIGEYVQLAAERCGRITHVVDTHLHADHVSGGRELAARTGAVYHLGAEDAVGASFAPDRLRDGETVRVSGASVRVLAINTPGHTPGSTCLLVNDEALLTGDTLFVTSVGRPDLGGRAIEWALDLYESIYGRLGKLPDDTLVLPAHYAGPQEIGDDGRVVTRLGELRRRNPVLQVGDREAFLEFVREHMPPEPAGYAEIRRINLGLVGADEERILELELGPNRCALGAMQAAG